MHRDAFISKLTEIQRTVEHLLSQLQASEHDAFAAHLYRSRLEYRLACEHAGEWQAKLGDGQQFRGYYSALLVREGAEVKIFEETVNVAVP